MITRQEYMDGKATHEQYYGQFVTDALKRAVTDRFGIETLVNSTDPHFNDIPLGQWDAFSQTMPFLVSMRKVFEAQGNRGWSLATVVCLAKEAARQVKQEHIAGN